MASALGVDLRPSAPGSLHPTFPHLAAGEGSETLPLPSRDGGGDTPPVSGGGLFLLAGLLAASFNLRPALASLSPLIETIRADLGLGHVTLSLLTVLPILCMGAVPVGAMRLAGRIGSERSMLLALLLIAAATGLRADGRNIGLLLATALLAGVGIAVAQALAPVLIKQHFAARATLVMGLYSAVMTLGAGVAAGLTAPLARTLASWPLALATWALPALLAAAFWLPAARQGTGAVATKPGAGLPWRSGTAWLVTLYSGAVFAQFWSVLTWLAPAFESRGASAEEAGLLLALMTAVQIVSSLAIAVLAGRSPDRRPWLALCLCVGMAAFAGIALIPDAAPAWLWTVLIGFGIGALFPLTLGLPLDYAPDAATVGRLATMTLSVGYLLAAAGPWLMGWLRGVTGSYALPFLTLALLCGAMLLATLRLRPSRERSTAAAGPP